MKKKKIQQLEKTATIPFKFPDVVPMTHGTNIKPDKLYAIVHLILLTHWRMRRNKKLFEPIDRATGWVGIDSERTLKLMMSDSYISHVRFLVDNGLIEIRKKEGTDKSSYHPNKYTMLYRINPKYISLRGKKRYRKVQITDHTTLKGIYRMIETKRKKSESLLKASEDYHFYDPLIEFGKNLRLDEVAIRRDLDAGLFTNEMRYEFPGIAIEFNIRNLGAASICTYGERLYQPLSRLNKPLREYLYDINNVDVALAEIDLKNSQPYHLSSLMAYPDLLNKFAPEFYPLKPYLENRCKDIDVKQFHFSCCNGSIYEQWISAIFKDQEPNEKLRDAAKKQLIGPIMFGRVESLSKNPGYVEYLKKIKWIFSSIYPSVWANLIDMKKYGGKLPFLSEFYKKGIQPYKSVSCLAQRVESRILLKSIPPLIRANVTSDFTSLHDSFIISSKHVESVKNIITEYYKSLGLWPPTMTVKLYKIAQH